MTENTLNFDEKIFLLKKKFGVKTDVELAKKLGISVYAIRSWKQRENLPKQYETILLKYLKFSNNTNSVIVNGNNSGSIINSHQIEVGEDLAEFISIFKKYGNSEMLKKYKKELLQIKEFMERQYE